MKKQTYKSPKIELFIIELEEGICSGSALVKPQNDSDVTTEWETGTDQNLTFSWN